MTFLPRALPPGVTRDVAVKYDALLKWALVSVIAGKGVGAAGLASADEVWIDRSLCRQQSMLGSDILPQAHFPVRESGLDLTSSPVVTRATYTGCRALALGQVLTAVSTRGLPALLERLSKRPLTKGLIAALREVAENATEGQPKDAEGTS